MTALFYNIQAEILDFLVSEGLRDTDNFAATAATAYAEKRVGTDVGVAEALLSRIRTNSFASRRNERRRLTADLIRRLDRRFLSLLHADLADDRKILPPQSLTENYDVALSFARPQRALAEQLSGDVGRAGFRAFYDYDFTADLWGKDLAVELDAIYRQRSRFCVMFISPEYVERVWPSWERRSALARAVAERGNEYILPLVVEPADVPGLPDTIARVSLAEHSMDEIAKLLISKLRTPTSGTSRS